MEPDAFKLKYHHILAGMMLDAATSGRSGAELSMWLRTVMGKVDSILMQAYFDARGDKPPEVPAAKPRESTFRPSNGPVGAAPSAAPKDAKPERPNT